MQRSYWERIWDNCRRQLRRTSRSGIQKETVNSCNSWTVIINRRSLFQIHFREKTVKLWREWSMRFENFLVVVFMRRFWEFIDDKKRIFYFKWKNVVILIRISIISWKLNKKFPYKGMKFLEKYCIIIKVIP